MFLINTTVPNRNKTRVASATQTAALIWPKKKKKGDAPNPPMTFGHDRLDNGGKILKSIHDKLVLPHFTHAQRDNFPPMALISEPGRHRLSMRNGSVSVNTRHSLLPPSCVGSSCHNSTLVIGLCLKIPVSLKIPLQTPLKKKQNTQRACFFIHLRNCVIFSHNCNTLFLLTQILFVQNVDMLFFFFRVWQF